MTASRTYEQHYPWVGSVLITGIAAAIVPDAIFVRAAGRLVEPILTLSSLAIGFLLTFATLLASMDRSPVVQELRQIDAYPILLSYLYASVYGWALVAGWSIIVGVIEPGTVDAARWSGILWLAFLAYGALSAHRVFHLMVALLRFKGRPRSRRDARDERVNVG